MTNPHMNNDYAIPMLEASEKSGALTSYHSQKEDECQSRSRVKGLLSWESFRVGARRETAKNSECSPLSYALVQIPLTVPKEFWKPMSLRSPVLGGFILFSVLCIVALEILSHISSSNGNGGGLVFAKETDEIPPVAVFG